MRILAPVGLVVLVIISYCQGQNQDSTVGSTPENLAAVSQSVTNLAQKISLAIANPKSKTEIFSPVSIAGALSLLLLGSGGATRDELINVMGFQNSRLSFTDIHKSFGRLFQDLVSNEPAQNVNIPWRANDKCNNYDYDEEDYVQQKPSSPQRGRRDTEKPVEIDVGNGIFAVTGREFDPKYQYIAEKIYGIETQYLDFENRTQFAVRTINDWVKQQTRGKITEIVSHLNPDTMLVIANTLYLKAEWEEPFLRDGTKPRPFFPDGPTRPSINVPMMVHGGCFPYYYWKEMRTKVLGIPYKQNSTMYVFLPDESNRGKIRTLQSNINAQTLNNIIKNMEVKTASVQFPKMHVQNSFNLKQVLEQLGGSTIFDREKSDLYRVLTNLTRLGEGGEPDIEDVLDLLEDNQENAVLELKNNFGDCITFEKDVDTAQQCLRDAHCRYGGRVCVCCVLPKIGRKKRQSQNYSDKKSPLFVNEIMHKVDVVVNEKGTEGGAVTATLLDRITPLVNFKANGPFLMLIREESTQLPLFYGSVYDPTP
ncbi:serine protease inhibitor 28Dc-like isoform X3 [Armigeres subalbatus]|uniref:serine protease inhibitor 28Dc-like isoform X3 n=1 Tax=Armigeres subalbatus TaxID=124917 RepID=UPI002ED2E174